MTAPADVAVDLAVRLPTGRVARLRVLGNAATRLSDRLRDVAALAAVGADVGLSLMDVAALSSSLSAELQRMAAPVSE